MSDWCRPRSHSQLCLRNETKRNEIHKLLQDCRGISDAGALSLITGIKLIKRLVLSGNKQITDVAMQALDAGRRRGPAPAGGGGGPGGANVDANADAGAQEGEIDTAMKRRERYKEMTFLDLSGTDIGDPGMLLVAEVCTNLVSLSLARCEQVGDIFLLGLLLKLFKLEDLDISHCPRITDKGIATLVSSDPGAGEGEGNEEVDYGGEMPLRTFKLRTLRVDGCDTLGDAGFASLFPRLPVLSTFSMVGANLLTDRTLQALAKSASCFASAVLFRVAHTTPSTN